MDKNYWQKKWQDNDIGFNQNEVNILLQRYFHLLNLKPGNRIFVPLCGKSIDMIWLKQQGYEVIGIDISPIACKTFFEENQLQFNTVTTGSFTFFTGEGITLIQGDFFQLDKNLLGNIDAVYDRAALIALGDDLRPKYANHLIKLLPPNSSILLITIAYAQREMRGPPFSVDQNEVNRLYHPRCQVKQLFHKPLKEIPVHLFEKGLRNAIAQAYFIFFRT